MDKLDNVFLQHCADVLASTHSPYILDIYMFYWLLATVPALGVFFWFIANLS